MFNRFRRNAIDVAADQFDRIAGLRCLSPSFEGDRCADQTATEVDSQRVIRIRSDHPQARDRRRVLPQQIAADAARDDEFTTVHRNVEGFAAGGGQHVRREQPAAFEGFEQSAAFANLPRGRGARDTRLPTELTLDPACEETTTRCFFEWHVGFDKNQLRQESMVQGIGAGSSSPLTCQAVYTSRRGADHFNYQPASRQNPHIS
ncbi:hypothetical protein RSSM_00640 [Rhodopirellula sallentina SM41]|uniref:Uncharacterized protein n=1 Tax=Rhodopirellula sallentina SM41 TaxID=1263870 RepID=M5UPH9_9BACT|nr:hypothetical protein RSSM_00640 [Rhodopirellula sallentina SM41]